MDKPPEETTLPELWIKCRAGETNSCPGNRAEVIKPVGATDPGVYRCKTCQRVFNLHPLGGRDLSDPNA